MARTDYGAILSTKIADTSQAIRDVNKTNALIAPADWGTLIRAMKSASDYENALEQMIEETASGSIVSFSDGANDIPVKSLVVNITATQSGTGDPSPDNKRPISGWSACKITRTGANIWGGDKILDDFINADIQGFSYDDTTLTYSAVRVSNIKVKNFVAKENTQYTFILVGKNSLNLNPLNLRVYYTDGTYSRLVFPTASADTKQTAIFTSTANKTISYLQGENSGGNVTLYYDECGVFEGVLTASDFEPYTADTKTIDLGQTIYGATINPLTGEGTITKKYYKVPGVDSQGTQSGIYFYRKGIADIGVNTVSGGFIISNMFKADTNHAPGSVLITSLGTSLHLTPLDQTIDTLAKMNEWLANNDVYVCYELATPVPFTFIPIENINTLLGDNNIFADTGDVEAVYRANGQLYVAQHT